MVATPLGRLLFNAGIPSATAAARLARLSSSTACALVAGSAKVGRERRRYSRSLYALARVAGVSPDAIEEAALATRRLFLDRQGAEAARLDRARVNAAERRFADELGIAG